MFEVDSIAERVIQRINDQSAILHEALHWSPSSPTLTGLPSAIEQSAEQAPTPLHANLALFVAIANGELDRDTIDAQQLAEIIERLQWLLDLLFKPVSGYYGYHIPPSFWTEIPIGQILARVQAWLRRDDLISYTDAAQLLYPDVAEQNLQAARMRVKRLVERGLLQSYSDPQAANPTQQVRISRQAAEALLATGQHLTNQRGQWM